MAFIRTGGDVGFPAINVAAASTHSGATITGVTVGDQYLIIAAAELTFTGATVNSTDAQGGNRVYIVTATATTITASSTFPSAFLLSR